jgi:hypothetical protein
VNTLLAPAARPVADQSANFWARLFTDSSMQSLGDLEKLLAGCEIIAALDDLDLLTARPE